MVEIPSFKYTAERPVDPTNTTSVAREYQMYCQQDHTEQWRVEFCKWIPGVNPLVCILGHEAWDKLVILRDRFQRGEIER